MKKAGGKLTSKHTTVIDAAADIVDFSQNHKLVTKISLGLIKPIKSSGGIKRIKITPEPACLFVTVRGNTAMQELRLYTRDIQTYTQELISFSKKNGFII